MAALNTTDWGRDQRQAHPAEHKITISVVHNNAEEAVISMFHFQNSKV